MAGRPRKPKTKSRTLPKAMEPYKFAPGQSGNPQGRPKTKVLTDIVRDVLDEYATKELFVNGLEHLKGKKIKISELLIARLVRSAVTGERNYGLGSLVEIWNHIEGKVPLPVVSRESESDPFIGKTDEELDQIAKGLVDRLLQLTEEKCEEVKQ